MKVASDSDLIAARAPSHGLEEEVYAVDSSGFHHKFVKAKLKYSRATSGTAERRAGPGE
jgi:hypothetical protein